MFDGQLQLLEVNPIKIPNLAEELGFGNR